MNKPAIKAILRVIRPRIYTGEGAFTYTDTMTGKMVEAQTSSPDNIRHLIRPLNGGEWEGNESRTYVTDETMGQRDFNRFIKLLPHVGSNPDDFAEFIKKELSK